MALDYVGRSIYHARGLLTISNQARSVELAANTRAYKCVPVTVGPSFQILITHRTWSVESSDHLCLSPQRLTSSELEDLKELESAIVEASQANILMFCLASDKGAKQVDTFPSKALPDKIFKIGGADANGGLYDRVGDIAAVDFNLPGQLVASEELSETAVGLGTQYWSGSSVAIALAAGLAGLILYCAHMYTLPFLETCLLQL